MLRSAEAAALRMPSERRLELFAARVSQEHLRFPRLLVYLEHGEVMFGIDFEQLGWSPKRRG